MTDFDKITGKPMIRLGLAALAAAAGVAVPATAHAAARPYIYPTASVRLAHTSVREPGTLTLTVTASTCLTALNAHADSEMSFTSVSTSVTGKPGRTFTLRFPFTTKDPSGEWVVSSVSGRECGHTGWTEIDPTKGFFPLFTVSKEK